MIKFRRDGEGWVATLEVRVKGDDVTAFDLRDWIQEALRRVADEVPNEEIEFVDERKWWNRIFRGEFT